MKKIFKKKKIFRKKKKRAKVTHVQLKSADIFDLRARLLAEQDGLCPICNKVIKDAILDHSHTKRIKGSGLIRGVLCRTCNVFLAKSENNCTRYAIGHSNLPSVLRRMADYLERLHLPYIHPSEKPKEPRLTKASYNRLKKKMDSFGYTKCPEYPKSKKLTKKLKLLFEFYAITPGFYK